MHENTEQKLAGGDVITDPPQNVYPHGFAVAPHVEGGGGGAMGGVGAAGGAGGLGGALATGGGSMLAPVQLTKPDPVSAQCVAPSVNVGLLVDFLQNAKPLEVS